MRVIASGREERNDIARMYLPEGWRASSTIHRAGRVIHRTVAKNRNHSVFCFLPKKGILETTTTTTTTHVTYTLERAPRREVDVYSRTCKRDRWLDKLRAGERLEFIAAGNARIEPDWFLSCARVSRWKIRVLTFVLFSSAGYLCN